MSFWKKVFGGGSSAAASADVAATSTANTTRALGPTLRETSVDGHRIVYDLASAKISLDLREHYRDPKDQPLEARLVPNVRFISAAVLSQKAKIFDDGLYAAIELAADRGLGTCSSKRELIAQLADRLRNTENAAAWMLEGAASLDDPARAISTAAAGALESFLGNTLRSKPIGFYTWSKDLERIFKRDRYLQSELSKPEELAAMKDALARDRDRYARHLELAAKLTNPLSKPSMLSAASEKRACLFPPSRAPETDLIQKLYGAKPIPPGFDLAEELLRRVRKKELSLAPQKTSGWYDHQLAALEPLLAMEETVEGARLQMSDEYRQSLVDLFKAIYALARETHIKQLDVPMAGGAPFRAPKKTLWLEPSLTVEPLATYYRLRADSYRFVEGVLGEIFGARAITEIHRLTEDGPVKLDLATELAQMELLFRNAASTAFGELGLGDSVPSPLLSESDPDLSRDLRMMVPIFYDVERKKTKVWAFLGWRTRALYASFASPPSPIQVFDARGHDVSAEAEVKFSQASFGRQEPVVTEIYVDEILDRRELRAVCDRCSTEREILNALDAGDRVG